LLTSTTDAGPRGKAEAKGAAWEAKALLSTNPVAKIEADGAFVGVGANATPAFLRVTSMIAGAHHRFPLLWTERS
jgi:hypothetical protein